MADTKPASARSSAPAGPAAGTWAITLTFGDQAENHVGMQKLGSMCEQGLSLADLSAAKARFEAAGHTCEWVDLVAAGGMASTGDGDGAAAAASVSAGAPPAVVLVVRGGVDALLGGPGGAAALYAEQCGLQHDRECRMYGRVVQKHARWNLCFGDEAQEPAYDKGLGRVYAFGAGGAIPLTTRLRGALEDYFGPPAAALVGEGNYYYDPKQCGIGFHGDAERRVVVAARLGVAIPLHFQWFQRGEPQGTRVSIDVRPGDVYAMSAKAVGTDWRCRKGLTLRHAAGAEKFLRIAK